ncbi:E3 ubiquitin-protein ligase CCNB1IP1 [Stegostoma tigrinum]|uniref:E3 ubiquitin-protein ligase CCNB1IP1 n=1 Tax=Stegostoma tigrinum TaxID=3053191 RepID=UPI00286FE7DB|nr:E3 ubiquitin-protein ligase CCNB1IP1 [Stegostoma tigrinum]
MAMCEDVLLCNFTKCRAKLSGFAWVTACSHVFCDQHGSGEFSRSPALCPACKSALAGKLDIVRTELSPSEEYKAMVLSGLRPELILDIASRALAFWTYQIHQERLYQEYAYSKAEGRLRQMEKLYTQQIQGKDMEVSNTRGEVASLKKLLEEYKKKYSEISEKLMERNRQYQKLQGLYDSLRLRTLAMTGKGDSAAPAASSGALYGLPTGGLVKYVPAESPHGRPGETVAISVCTHPFLALPPRRGLAVFFAFSPGEEGVHDHQPPQPHPPQHQPLSLSLGANSLYKMKKM